MKNFKIVFIFILLLISITPSLKAALPSYTPDMMDSVLIKLDETITNKQIYTKAKQETLNALYQKLINTQNDEDCFNIYGELFEQLKKNQMDSALVVAYKRLNLAERMKSSEKIFYANMNITEVIIVTGMYKKALDILNQIDKSQVSTPQ